ncbi:hypothetical protein ACFL35_09505 [Candidatus Riflebacteria bacterium]
MLKVDKEPLTIWDGVIFVIMAFVVGGMFYLNYSLGDYSVSVAIFRDKTNVIVTGNGRVEKVNPGLDKARNMAMVIDIAPKSEKHQYVALFHRVEDGLATPAIKIGDSIAFRGLFLHGGATGTHKIYQTNREPTGKKPDMNGWIKVGGKQYPPPDTKK